MSTFPAVIDLSTLFDDGYGISILGETAGDAIGDSVSLAGDINGDGIGDIIIGARTAYNGGDYGGAAYVIFGRASWADIDIASLSPQDGFIIIGDGANDWAGFSVSSAGDVNGDGIADLIVGAPYGDDGGANAGEAYVIFGKTGATRADIDLSSLAATDGFIIQGDEAGDRAGTSVSSAGDINQDGIDDLIVGAPFGNDGGAWAGEAYVVFGKAGAARDNIDLSSLDSADGFVIQGDAADDQAGRSVSSAGDINGDGIHDLIVGARYGGNDGTSTGEAYVIFGKVGATRADIDLTSLAAEDGFIIQGDLADDQAGRSVSTAGDVNGDGIDDLIVGAPFGDNGGADAGEAYVIFGKAGATRTNIDLSSLAAEDGFIIQGDAAGDFAGLSVSAAGDINGDGVDDLIIGAPFGDDAGVWAGEAYVVFGKPVATRANIDLSSLSATDGFIIQGSLAGDRAGSSVSSAGDVDGDGVNDLIVAAQLSDTSGNNAGEAYVIFGRIDPLLPSILADNLTGTAGDDIVDLLSGEDTYSGLAGNDTITGGAGVDTLSGDAGNDRFIVNPGDLASGETYDGGADDDTLEFAGNGTFDLAGVTLTSIEAIELTGSAGTHLTLGDNSQAALIALADGAADRVDLASAVRMDLWDQSGLATLLSLFGAGVEQVTWADNGWGGDSVADLGEGGAFAVTSTDTTGQPWTTRTTQFDAAGAIQSELRQMDDGRTTETVWNAGVKVSYEVVDVDDDFTTFASQLRTFHANGEVATFQTIFDEGGSLAAQTVSYDDAGLRTAFEQELADGRIVTLTYDASGNVTSRSVEDLGEAFAWASKLAFYDAAGNVTSTRDLYDSGNVIARGGAGNDIVSGGDFNDTLWGLGGADDFVYTAGMDRIRDFDLVEGDRLDLTAFDISDLASLQGVATVTDLANALFIDFGGGNTLRIDGLALAQLDDGDFV